MAQICEHVYENNSKRGKRKALVRFFDDGKVRIETDGAVVLNQAMVEQLITELRLVRAVGRGRW